MVFHPFVRLLGRCYPAGYLHLPWIRDPVRRRSVRCNGVKGAFRQWICECFPPAHSNWYCYCSSDTRTRRVFARFPYFWQAVTETAIPKQTSSPIALTVRRGQAILLVRRAERVIPIDYWICIPMGLHQACQRCETVRGLSTEPLQVYQQCRSSNRMKSTPMNKAG